MLLFFSYQLKSYNKQGIYGQGRKSEKLLDTYFILLFMLWSQFFNAQNAICNCVLLCYLRVTYSLVKVQIFKGSKSVDWFKLFLQKSCKFHTRTKIIFYKAPIPCTIHPKQKQKVIQENDPTIKKSKAIK